MPYHHFYLIMSKLRLSL